MDFNELVRRWPDMCEAERVCYKSQLTFSQLVDLETRVKNAPNSNAEMLRSEMARRLFKKLIV